MKHINRTMSLSDIVTLYPETNQIMIELGFKETSKPGMLKMMGKILTLEKGAKMKNIDMDDVIKSFSKGGYQLL